MLKQQRFGDSESAKTELKRLKRWYLNKRDNKEGNGLDNEKKNCLDKNEGKIEDDRYILSSFIPFFFLSQKGSNRISDLGKRIKSLIYIIYIQKILYSKSVNFTLEFPGRSSSKAYKKNLYQSPKRKIIVPPDFHSFHNFRHYQLPFLNQKALEITSFFQLPPRFRNLTLLQPTARFWIPPNWHYIQLIHKRLQHLRSHTFAYKSPCYRLFFVV